MMKILVVDEECHVRGPLRERLVHEGYGVVEAEDGLAASAVLEREAPDLVLLDVLLPDAGGLLKGIRERAPDLPVIVTATSASIDEAVEAVKRGAFDYVAKSVSTDELALTVKRALEAAELRRIVSLQTLDHKARYGVTNLVGPSRAMQGVRSLIETVARSQTPMVLVRGESGTGKDLVAKAIHAESARANKPFVNITCTALQDTLLESELFGHERGAFTDAKALKKGLLEVGHGGTVLLDEIGDMSPALQGKLLRVLEEKTFRRVGGSNDIRVDVRIVACTHVDLERLIEERKFREDLYYRLNAITIDVPPLRERREDLAPLTDHFVVHFGRELKKGVSAFSEQARQKLQAYDWPGNVRELRNVIERAVLLGPTSTLSTDDVVVGRPSTVLGSDSSRCRRRASTSRSSTGISSSRRSSDRSGTRPRPPSSWGSRATSFTTGCRSTASLKPRTQGVRPRGERPSACGEGAGAACVAQYGRARCVRPANGDRPRSSVRGCSNRAWQAAYRTTTRRDVTVRQ